MINKQIEKLNEVEVIEELISIIIEQMKYFIKTYEKLQNVLQKIQNKNSQNSIKEYFNEDQEAYLKLLIRNLMEEMHRERVTFVNFKEDEV